MNILCIDTRSTSAVAAWELISDFLQARYSQADCHLRRLSKIAFLEEWHTAPHYPNSVAAV